MTTEGECKAVAAEEECKASGFRGSVQGRWLQRKSARQVAAEEACKASAGVSMQHGGVSMQRGVSTQRGVRMQCGGVSMQSMVA